MLCGQTLGFLPELKLYVTVTTLLHHCDRMFGLDVVSLVSTCVMCRNEPSSAAVTWRIFLQPRLKSSWLEFQSWLFTCTLNKATYKICVYMSQSTKSEYNFLCTKWFLSLWCVLSVRHIQLKNKKWFCVVTFAMDQHFVWGTIFAFLLLFFN